MTEPLLLGTLCSGIGAPEQAAHQLGGWRSVFASEIAEWPRRILAARFGFGVGNGPNLFGDFTAVDIADYPACDVLVAGTPCQAFSVAGGRLSLADARGNLTIAALGVVHGLAARSIRPLRNFIWENVPGVLNTRDNAFGCFLGELVGADAPICPPGAQWGWIEGKGDEPGAYGWQSCRFTDAGMVSGPRGRAAWRVLNSQYFGLAQRRQRVFVVADFGNGADPAAVLFEPRGRAGDFAPSGGQGENSAADAEDSTDSGGFYPGVAGTLGSLTGGFRTTDLDGIGAYIPQQSFGDGVSGTQSAGAHPGSYNGQDAFNNLLVPVAFDLTQITSPTNRSNPQPGDPAPPLTESGKPPVMAFKMRGREGGNMPEVMPGELSPALATDGGGSSLPFIATDWMVRRLTPVEFARLQGFPDHHCHIVPDMPFSAIYSGFGNSMSVDVVQWVMGRLQAQLQAT